MFKWFKKLIGRYDDYSECGYWGSFNPETGESKSGGKLYSRTIKVEDENGKIVLDSEWITDEQVEKEKSGGEMDGPASPSSDIPDDPTKAADWWKK